MAANVQNEHIVQKLLDNGALVDGGLEDVQGYVELYHTHTVIARLLYHYARPL